MYAEFLAANHFVPLQAETTDEGLRAAPNADIIVTGIRVRGSFDGIELVRRLRHDHQTRTKPLIVLTACAFEPDQQRAHLAGCDVFLPKPCLPETLLAAIRALANRGNELPPKTTHKSRAAKAALRAKDAIRRVIKAHRISDRLHRRN
jgi:DNA-binding response OmpR family regulator